MEKGTAGKVDAVIQSTAVSFSKAQAAGAVTVLLLPPAWKMRQCLTVRGLEYHKTLTLKESQCVAVVCVGFVTLYLHWIFFGKKSLTD